MRRLGIILFTLILATASVFANGSSETGSGTSSSIQVKQSDSRTLIVYFTPANNDTADAVSSATPRVDGTASVEYLANLISSRMKADVARITAKESYPLAYNDTADKARQEQNRNERPAFSLDVNPEDYDTIFIGYPIWWYRLPMIMQTFFDTYDFSGKTIVPFMTHQGSRDGGTFNEIKQLEAGATVAEGIAVRGDRAANAGDDVAKWLSGLGY